VADLKVDEAKAVLAAVDDAALEAEVDAMLAEVTLQVDAEAVCDDLVEKSAPSVSRRQAISTTRTQPS
jgi:hypothetical protein